MVPVQLFTKHLAKPKITPDIQRLTDTPCKRYVYYLLTMYICKRLHVRMRVSICLREDVEIPGLVSRHEGRAMGMMNHLVFDKIYIYLKERNPVYKR